MTIPVLLASLVSLSAPLEDGVLEFTAPWCQPCQRMSPVVSRLQREGYRIRKVDVEQQPRLARRFAIKNVPTFILLVNGKEAKRIEGATTASTLRAVAMRVRRTDSEHRDRLASKSGHSKQPVPERLKPESAITKTDAVAASPKRGSAIKSLFQIPFFRRTPKQDSSSAAEATVVRAKYGDPKDGNRGRNVSNSSALSSDPSASCIRIRVKDGSGVSFGSGTVIDSRPGRSLILTCGHIFRELGRDATISVDVFGNGRSESFLGQIVRYDLKADVGLISISTAAPLFVSQVATHDSGVAKGRPVFSVGCDGGEIPTKQQHRITALNRYQGPDTVECTGVPVQGRSGGGLFNAAGQLVGVCIAADHRDRRGLYAGLKPIHQLLNQSGLASLFQRGENPDVATSIGSVADRQSSVPAEFGYGLATTGQQMPSTTSAGLGQGATASPTEVAFSELSDRVAPANVKTERGAALHDLEDIRAALNSAGEAEVVCIIRPLGKTGAPSRVVIINRASPRFIADLTGELQAQGRLTSTKRKSRSVVTPVAASRIEPVDSNSPMRYRRFGTRR